MSCGCIYVESDESYKTISCLKIRAVHSRECQECRRTIERGEIYEYFIGTLGESNADTWITCSDCLSVRNVFFCNGWAFESIWEDVCYHVEGMDGKIDSECLAELTPRARAGVIDIIDEIWAEIDDEEK